MTDLKANEQIIGNPKERRSLILLTVSSIALFLLTLLTFWLVWLLNNNELKRYYQLVVNDQSEAGGVKGESTSDPNYLSNLATNLKTAGFVLYGSAQNQKTIKQRQLFGQAAEIIDFVECDPRLESANSAECLAKGIKIYPTWVSGDKKIEGFQSLSQLEKLILENNSTLHQ